VTPGTSPKRIVFVKHQFLTTALGRIQSGSTSIFSCSHKILHLFDELRGATVVPKKDRVVDETDLGFARREFRKSSRNSRQFSRNRDSSREFRLIVGTCSLWVYAESASPCGDPVQAIHIVELSSRLGEATISVLQFESC
jgi:hypothetical protein